MNAPPTAKALARLKSKAYSMGMTLVALNNIQFLVDKDKFRHYAMIAKLSGVPNIKPMMDRMRKLGPPRNTARMRWDTIVECANVMQIPAELLVDADYHTLSGRSMAGYNVLFEAQRQGITIEQLVNWSICTIGNREPLFSSWVNAWYYFFKGRYTDYMWVMRIPQTIQILRVCQDHLHMTRTMLLPLNVRTSTKNTVVISELTDVLLMLDNNAVNTLVQTAILLRDSKVLPDSVIQKRLMELVKDVKGVPTDA